MSTTFSTDTFSTDTFSTETFDPTSTRSSHAAAVRPTFWKTGLVSGVGASIANTVIVLAARAADVGVAVDGERIPLLGFAQLTLIGALIGTVMARVMSRRADHPRRTFLVTTVVLTALSLIPDVIVDASLASKATLMVTHLVAAAIIVPALARRLAPAD